MNWLLNLPRWPIEWGATIIAAIVVAHLLNYILKVLLKKPVRDALIPVLEVFVVVVVGGTAAHTVLRPANNDSALSWWNDPILLGIIILVLLVGFTVLSIALYILDKRYGHKPLPEGN